MSATRSAIAIVASLWLVGAGVAAAQYTGAADKPAGVDNKGSMGTDRSMDKPTATGRTTARSERSAMPAGETIGRHSAQGEITSLDAKKGWVNVKTSEGTMIVQLPPSSLQGLKKGDTITVDLAMKSTGEHKAK